jgi:ABC-type antimicrobial peptide transport system permease subunit
MKNLIELSLLSLKRHKRIYRACTVSIAISTVLVLFFLSLHNGIGALVDNELKRQPEFREVEILPFTFSNDPREASSRKELFSAGDFDILTQTNSIKSITVKYRVENIASCFLDDVEVLGAPDWLDGLDVGYDTFSLSRVESEKTKNESFSEIVAGRDFEKSDTNVCLIDEGSVYWADIKNPTELVGKTLRIVHNSGEELEATIIGVYSQNLSGNAFIEPPDGSEVYYEYDDPEDEGKIEIFLESMLFSSDVIKRAQELSALEPDSLGYLNILLSMPDLESTVQVHKILQERYANELICALADIYEVIDYLKLLSNMFVFLGAILLVLSLFNLYSTIMMTTEKKKKWFALQSIVGFERHQISLCYIIEIILAVFKGFVLGLLCVFILCAVVSLGVSEIFGTTLVAHANAFLPPPLACILVAGILLFSLALLSIVITREISNIDEIRAIF